MKKVKAFKINVVDRRIEDVKVGSLQDYYDAIGNGCDMIEIGLSFGKGDCIMVDEEGLFHDNIGGFLFRSPSRSVMTSLHGNGIVIGVDEEGEDKVPSITKKELILRTQFISPELIQDYRDSQLNEPIIITTHENTTDEG